jgi:tetratricopeptide (TPR) repeat protein
MLLCTPDTTFVPAKDCAGETASLEKAIEIKRRAQRCVQNGDLDGALGEYEKLVAADDSDPYNFVLLADLLYKKGDHGGAAKRYLSAAEAYQKNTLYKNAIAVCKKMVRLSLSPALVLQKLAVLHGLDGLTTEAVLFHMQHADLMLREDKPEEAATSLKAAFELSPENVKTLERLADVYLVKGDKEAAAATLADAVARYQEAGQTAHAERCRNRMLQLKPGGMPRVPASRPPSQGAPPVPGPRAAATPAAPTGTMPPLEPPAAKIPALEPLAIERPAPAAAEHAAPADIERHPQAAPPTSLAGTPLEGLEGPGLRFHSPADPPAAAPASATVPPGEEDHSMRTLEPVAAAPAPGGAAPDGSAAPSREALARVEKLLTAAQEQFRAGNREVATSALVEAARGYEELGEYDSAATIYRSLSRTATAARDVMALWLRNCEARSDMVEGAQVACELGDLALNEGDQATAVGWFKRARALDGTNALALRRLERLRAATPADAGEPVEAGVAVAPGAPIAQGAGAAPAAAPAAPASGGYEAGRVEVEVGRGGAVTFDLGSLVSEFQRGIEAQISGDAQGHYDLAMTYREMGLLDQAIEAFRNAAVDAAFTVRCTEMIGRSLLDEGRFDDAAREFETGLNLPGLTPMARADLRYQLGLAQEAAGRPQEALAEFERVYAMQASYPDVALKIRVLRKTLESL